MRISLLTLAAFGALLCTASPAVAQAHDGISTYQLPPGESTQNQRLPDLGPAPRPDDSQPLVVELELSGARLRIGGVRSRTDSFGRDYLPGEPLQERKKGIGGALLTIPIQPPR